MRTLISIILLNAALAEEPSGIRRITLEEAQARAADIDAAGLAELGVDAARYHREAVQADYFPRSTPHSLICISINSWAKEFS
jgi:hypothetical protein